MRWPTLRIRGVAMLWAAAAMACGPGGRRDAAQPPAPAVQPDNLRATLQPTSLPDLSRVEAQLRQRLEGQQAALDALLRVGQASDADLASAFGAQGKLCLAADFAAAAIPNFVNARQLAPREFPFAYYLAHAYRLTNDAPAARRAMGDAVALRPDDVPARVWLARLLIDEGQVEEALTHLDVAVKADSRSAAARFELGRAALGRQQFGEAVTHLEAALALDPKATGIHFPLATAYRGVKDEARAAAHAKLWREAEVIPSDPLMEEVGALLRTSLDFAMRGTRALDAGNFAEAAALFKKGLELAPTDPAMHLNLGTSLYLSGSPAAALAEFEEAARVSPGFARAHFSAGVLLEESGRDDAAVARFTTALALAPTLVDARFSLADALRRAGKPEASLPHYQAIVMADPSASQARFGLAMAYVRLARYRDARQALEEAVKAHPDQSGLSHALARVLAAAPDPTVRDGVRAAAIVGQLRRLYQSPALTETAAMAAAGTGYYAEAAKLQRAALAEARRAGQADSAQALARNLQLYEQGKPSPQPWADDDPVHQPRRAAPIGREDSR